MCVGISIGKDVEAPSNDILEQCAQVNKDGAGIAWIEKGRVRWAKGFGVPNYDKKKERTLEHMYAMIRKIGVGPLLIHFRITSVGQTCPQLTHPFPVTRDAQTDIDGYADQVIIHNGHWTTWDDKLFGWSGGSKLPRGLWSDSRAIAYFLNRFGEVFLNHGLPNYNKLATLRADGDMWQWNGWDRLDNVCYSNMLWKKATACPAEGYMSSRGIYYDYRDPRRFDSSKTLTDLAKDTLSTNKIQTKAELDAKDAAEAKTKEEKERRVSGTQLALAERRAAKLARRAQGRQPNAAFLEQVEADMANDFAIRVAVEERIGHAFSDEEWDRFGGRFINVNSLAAIDRVAESCVNEMLSSCTASPTPTVVETSAEPAVIEGKPAIEGKPSDMVRSNSRKV